jgi:hypothetical protein
VFRATVFEEGPVNTEKVVVERSGPVTALRFREGDTFSQTTWSIER